MKFASSFISFVCLAATATANYAAVDQPPQQQQEVELTSTLVLGEQSTTSNEVSGRKLKSTKKTSKKTKEPEETEAPFFLILNYI